jgi:hypothetical protein
MSRMKISDRFILDGESIKPKYSQKHVDSMMDEFKGILEMENTTYIRNKAYRKFKKEVKDKGMVYEHRDVVLDFT